MSSAYLRKFVLYFVAIAALLVSSSAAASFHLWQIDQVYSNASGTVQYVRFTTVFGGQQFLGGHFLNAFQGPMIPAPNSHFYTIANDLPSDSTGHKFLVGTQGMADLGIVMPDYVVPNGFLFLPAGIIDFAGVDSVIYASLPTDGITAIDRSGNMVVNAPTNFSGVTGQLTAAATPPQTGWWWNPAENGRGFFLEKNAGSTIFVASYLYAATGRATWYASSSQQSVGSYAGSLDSYSGGQTLTGAYNAPVPTIAGGGAMTLTFSNASHGSINWAGGTTPIERFNFADNSNPPAFQPQPGWWWNAAESGRGFSLEVQGSTVFLAGYMYDAAGNPIWYLSSGTLTGQTYQGTWTQYANGQTLGGAYVLPTVINNAVGQVSIQFSSATAGTMTLPDGRVISITRFVF